MLVRITKSTPFMWYHDCIGDEFMVNDHNENSYRVADGQMIDAMVYKNDCEVVQNDVSKLNDMYRKYGYEVIEYRNHFEVKRNGCFARWFYSIEGLENFYKEISSDAA